MSANIEYVIYLSSLGLGSRHSEDYGYWTGRDYVHDGELFPCTESKITQNTKIYHSKKTADRGLKCALERPYEYVTCGEVRIKD